MKKSILILIGFVAGGMVVQISLAQYGAHSGGNQKGNEGEATLIHRPAETQVVDVRSKYDSLMNQKKDGDFLLYTDDEGTRVYVPIKKGRAGAYHAVGSSGQKVSVSVSNERGQCFACWGPLCKHKIQVQCAAK